MKYESTKQRRKVSEFMDSLLLPIREHLKEDKQELLDIALRIIRNTEIENKEVE